MIHARRIGTARPENTQVRANWKIIRQHHDPATQGKRYGILDVQEESDVAQQQFPVTNEHVRIFGRTLRIRDALWLGWSGSGIEFTTDASEVTVEITAVSATGLMADAAYLGIILDDNEAEMTRIRIERGEHSYTVLSNFELRRHTVRLVKLTEARNDKVGLLSLTADTPLVPTKEPVRRLLFIGDSITAGYGVDCKDPMYYNGLTTSVENVTMAYSWRTARALGADCHVIAWSGNGIISHYIDPDTDLPVTEDLMPSLYPYVDRSTEEIVRIYLSARGESRDLHNLTVFDPESYIPDTIVTYLGTNDATFTREIPVREQYFTDRYVQLLNALRKDYPNARRIVLYGTMERSLSEACAHAAALTESDYLELPMMDPQTEGMGAIMHPSAITHQRIADILVQNIEAADALRAH